MVREAKRLQRYKQEILRLSHGEPKLKFQNPPGDDHVLGKIWLKLPDRDVQIFTKHEAKLNELA